MRHPSAVEIFAMLSMALLAVPSVVVLVRAGQRRSGPQRRAFHALAAGAALTTLSAVFALLISVGWHGDPGFTRGEQMLAASGVAVCGTLGMVALFAGMLSLPGGAVGWHAVVRHLLDAVVIAAAIWFVSWALITQPPDFIDDKSIPEGCLPMLLPAGTAAIAVGLAVIGALRCPAPRTIPALVGGGVTLVAVAGIGVAGAACRGAVDVVGFSALTLPLGLLGVAAAAFLPDRAEAAEEEHVTRGGTAIAFLPMAAMSVAVLYFSLSGGSFDAVGLSIANVEGFALVARQYLALVDVRRYASRLQQRESHFRELAHTDPLTGLANRRGLLRALKEEAVGGPPCVLMGMDLDGFKNINDMRGHDVGDRVLTEVGRRLRANLRPGDLAARLGGDEFAVLMWAAPKEAQRVAERLLRVLCQQYDQPEGTVFLSVSIGLAGCATATDVPSLLRNADLALRSAKQRGKCRVEQYDAGYDQLLRRRTTLEHELRGAIDRGELHLAYQPVVTLPSVRPVGAEALLRWHHPTLGQVSPEEFIPVAEESGVISRLGTWVLHQACHQLSRWLADGHDVWVSVNVSPRELHSPEYVTQVAQALEAHRVPPQRLVLEVTEHAVATDLDELARRLRALRHTGVRIALDDFGAGYSSLGQLRNLPVDILKIDQSLVAEPESSRTGTAAPLVDVVVRLGHRLGLEVIAEGIADPKQRVVVETAGCRWGQGRLFGSPVPAEHVEARLAALTPTAAPAAALLTSAPPAKPARPGRSGSKKDGTPTLPAQHVRAVDSSREMRQA